MNDSHMLQLYRSMDENQILFCFRGALHQGVIEELGEAVRGYVKQSETRQHPKQTAFRRVFAAFIEQSQNSKRYLDRLANPAAQRSAIVVIGKSDGSYFVRSGNHVRKRDTPPLQRRLEYIRKMDQEELNTCYKEIIHSARSNQSAGLGMIHMARQASRPLEFSFTPVDDTYDFFSLSVRL